MAGSYDVLVQYGDELIPLSVPQNGTFRDLKQKYYELFDVPPGKQAWGGRIGELGIDDDVRVLFLDPLPRFFNLTFPQIPNYLALGVFVHPNVCMATRNSFR